MANQKTALSKVDSFKSLINTQAMVKRMTTGTTRRTRAYSIRTSTMRGRIPAQTMGSAPLYALAGIRMRASHGSAHGARV